MVRDDQSDAREGQAGRPGEAERFIVYPVHAKTRKSFGEMTRKLSVTESQIAAQFLGTLSRRKSRVAVGEFGASFVAFVVGDVSVHNAP